LSSLLDLTAELNHAAALAGELPAARRASSIRGGTIMENVTESAVDSVCCWHARLALHACAPGPLRDGDVHFNTVVARFVHANRRLCRAELPK